MRKFILSKLQAVNSINYKNQLLIILMLFSIAIKGQSQNIGINATGAVANASAILDIVSTTKGLLIPRITHTAMTSIGAPQTGLLVFTTDAPSSFYFYNGAAWVPLLSNSTVNGGWAITGNSGTTPSTAAIGTAITANSNFVGTSSNQDFVIATGATTKERLRIASGGNVGISNSSPSALLDIGTVGYNGVMRLEGSTSGYVGIQPAAAAGGWTMTLPPNTGTNGQVLTTDGTGITSWTTVSAGGITTVNGTAPIYVTNPTTAPNIWIHGASADSGAVLYSTGSGNSALFNAQGIAPKDSVKQVLVSQGAGIPTWNTIGGYTYLFYKGDSLMDESKYNRIYSNGWTNKYMDIVSGRAYAVHGEQSSLYMPKCKLTRVRVTPFSNTFTGVNVTFTVLVNQTAIVGGTGTVNAGTTAAIDLLLGNPVPFADDDYLEIEVSTSSNGEPTHYLCIGKIEITTYPLH